MMFVTLGRAHVLARVVLVAGTPPIEVIAGRMATARVSPSPTSVVGASTVIEGCRRCDMHDRDDAR